MDFDDFFVTFGHDVLVMQSYFYSFA